MSYNDHIKPFFDKVLALALMVLLLPLTGLITLFLFATQGKSIFFIQRRSGKDLKPFNMFKFRTLEPDDSGSLSMENRAFTPLGRFMRAASLDELPQLINVLRGEMSLVGPRPMPVEYDGRYSQNQLRRFDVRPGITGWAQVNGRNAISWEKRFSLDAEYVEGLSFLFDLRILWMTVVQAFGSLTGKNKSHEEMPVFQGINMMTR